MPERPSDSGNAFERPEGNTMPERPSDSGNTFERPEGNTMPERPNDSGNTFERPEGNTMPERPSDSGEPETDKSLDLTDIMELNPDDYDSPIVKLIITMIQRLLSELVK